MHIQTPRQIDTQRERERDSFVCRPSNILHPRFFFQLLLLHNGAMFNAKDSLGNTPLHLTTARGHDDVGILSLNCNKQDLTSYIPTHHPIIGQLTVEHFHTNRSFFFFQCAKALVFFDQGSGLLNIDATNDFGDSSLHLASKWGFCEQIAFLVYRLALTCGFFQKKKKIDYSVHGFKGQSGPLRGLVGSALDHRSLPPEFESQHGHI